MISFFKLLFKEDKESILKAAYNILSIWSSKKKKTTNPDKFISRRTL